MAMDSADFFAQMFLCTWAMMLVVLFILEG